MGYAPGDSVDPGQEAVLIMNMDSITAILAR